MSEDLPVGWTSVSLGEVVSRLVDGSHNPPPRQALGQPMLSARNISDGRIDTDEFRPISDAAFEREDRRTNVQAGDVLLTIVGSIGRSAVIPEGQPRFTLQRSVAVLSPTAVLPHFLSYQLRSPSVQKYLSDNARGTAQKGIYLNSLAQTPLLIAPSQEQSRIVSKIDELLSEIEEGERALERVQKLVERYRQSVLKAAVTGELTREWREKHKGKLESGEALLARILKGRHEAWEHSELAKMKAKGQKPTNDNWKSKYKEPVAPDTSDLPDLPGGWVWATVEQLCFVETGATPKRGTDAFYKNGTIPWVTSGAVNQDVIISAEERITEAAIEETNAKVFPIGTLLVAMYGEGKTRGKISELRIAAATNQACAALITGHLYKEVKAFLRLFFEKNYESLRSESAGGVQPNLNLTIIKETAIPLLPLQELQAIIDMSQSNLAQAQNAQREFGVCLNHASSLRQSILKRAFSGKLVDPDPTEEPASALLERIAAESNQSKAKQLRKPTRRKKVTA